MITILQDLRYAVRQLIKAPGFTLTAILSLACGIAATTAVFSIIWAVVVHPFPYAAPERLVHFAINSVSGNGYDPLPVTESAWFELQQLPSIEDSVLINHKRVTITGNDLPEDVQASEMSANAFHFFGVPPAIGRGLIPSDAQPGHDPAPVVVLGYKFWQRRFHGDPMILGKSVAFDQKPYIVIGIAAKRFTWNDADIYLPLKLTAGPAVYEVEARLRPGSSHALAEQQMKALVEELHTQNPALYPAKSVLHIIGINDQFLLAIGPALGLVFGAVTLLLAIGCGNVSILLLARGLTRRHEFALRAAIGASRARIIRQLLTEASLLSLSGAAIGILFAFRLLAAMVALLPEDAFPHEAAIGINLPVLVFSVLVALATGLVFGLWPALRLSHPDVREAMQPGGRKVAGSRENRAAYHALIAAQMALTLLMLAISGAAIESFLKLANVPLGYDPHNVISVGIPLRVDPHKGLAAAEAYVEQIRERIAATPGVRAAAVSNAAVPPTNGINSDIDLLGESSSAEQSARVNFVSPEFFRILKISLQQGRIWSEAENHNALPVVVVNQAFAHKYYPSTSPLGHSLDLKLLQAPPSFVVTSPNAQGWLQIVGVIDDKRNDGLRNPVVPEVFIPYPLAIWSYAQVLVSADRNPIALLHSIGKQIAQVDSNQQISGHTADLESWIHTTTEYEQGHLISWLTGFFAALALTLAAVGLYSIVSYTVAQRTNEFGIRMALGARRSNVLALVLQSAVSSVAWGAGAGLVLSLVVGRFIAHLTSSVPVSVTPILSAILVLALVTLIASGIPARRAARVEPMEALRYE